MNMVEDNSYPTGEVYRFGDKSKIDEYILEVHVCKRCKTKYRKSAVTNVGHLAL